MNYIFNFDLTSLGKGDTLIHRLHPLIKLFFFIFSLCIFINTDSVYLRLLFILISFLVILVTSKKIKILFYIIFFNLIITFSYLVMYFILGADNKLYLTFLISIRVFSFILPVIIYNMFTSFEQTIYSIEIILSPLRKVGLPINDIMLLLMITLNFIPIAFKELDRILLMQSMRGLDFKSSSIVLKVKIIINSIVPLLISLIDKSLFLVIAIELRKYSSFSKRSKYKKYKLLLKK